MKKVFCIMPPIFYVQLPLYWIAVIFSLIILIVVLIKLKKGKKFNNIAAVIFFIVFLIIGFMQKEPSLYLYEGGPYLDGDTTESIVSPNFLTEPMFYSGCGG